MDYFRVWLSFLHAVRVMLTSKECSGLGIISDCSDHTISEYTRIACAVSLQKVYKPLEEACVRDCHGYVHTHEHIVSRHQRRNENQQNRNDQSERTRRS